MSSTVLQDTMLLVKDSPLNEQWSYVLLVSGELVGQSIFDELKTFPSRIKVIFWNAIEEYQPMIYLWKQKTRLVTEYG